jgi:hypothetical protein
VSAADALLSGVRAMLPPDAPELFTLKSAKWHGSGRRREAVGEVTMFDGRPARLAVGTHEMGGHVGLSHYWISLPGGACSLEDGRWLRVPDGAA